MRLEKKVFNEKYEELILSSKFIEIDDYYIRERSRYFHTIKLLLASLSHVKDLSKIQMLEIGGGQISLLMNGLFGCKIVIADVNDKYSASLIKQGFEFRVCDLLHDDLPDKDRFDLVILCEVIEHMPVPPYQILLKIKTWMRPGGLLFVTTPNVYRLRNVVRLALGLRVFDYFMIPERGQSIGHPIEYSSEHLSWHFHRANFSDPSVSCEQLSFSGATLAARMARMFLSPLLLRMKFRDSLVATGRVPE